ncbi:MAG: XRE family transcriptional regulator [Nitrospinota bacterium]
MEKFSSYLADHVRPVIDKKYRTRSDAADDLGIDQAVLSRICSGKRFGISEHLVENICLRMGLDPAEGLLRLFLSKNPKIKHHFFGLTKKTAIEIVHPDKHRSVDIANKSISGDLLSIPIVQPDSLIYYTGNSKVKSGEYTLVPKNFLPKNGDFVSFKIKGDSMALTLPDGSLVAVDLSDTQESHNSIYIFKQKNEVKFGRAFIQGSFLQMNPDNPNRNKFPSYTYDMEKSRKDSPILGKVVWSLKKL